MTVKPIGFNKKYVCVFINVTRSRVTFKTPNEMARAVEISALNLPVLLLHLAQREVELHSFTDVAVG